MKNKKMIIALGVPFFIIVLILIKIVHTVQSGRNDPFTSMGGMVFTKEMYMQNFDNGLPIDKAIYAVVKARKETNIISIMEERANKFSENKKYQWLAIAVMDKARKNWLVTFRENFIAPVTICQTRVQIINGKVSDLKCSLSDDTKKGPR